MQPSRVAAVLLSVLRPGLQVPLANACAFGGVAALVMHVMRTAAFAPPAFPVGVALVAGASVVVMRLLFGGPADAHRARVQAFLWPPLVGALVGASIDCAMNLASPQLRFAFLGEPLGGGPMEAVAVGLLTGLAGLLGTALLLPQIAAIARARAAADEDAARLTRIAERVTAATWAAALGIAAVSAIIAARDEVATATGLVIVAAIGFAAQVMKPRLARESLARAVALPYR